MPSDYPTCDTCEHWRHIRDEDYTADVMGEEREWDSPHGECMAFHSFSDDKKAWLSVLAFIRREDQMCIEDPQDGQIEWDASFITKPNFGCRLHSDLESSDSE